MPTAYTPLLGFALPVTGELSGTWGDTINSYITEYIDASVAGSLTLSTDASVTLSITNGSALGSTSAQYSTLNMIGVRTAVRVVTLPLSSRSYIVFNSTTGGYNVTVGGVTVYNGERCTIAYNTATGAYEKVNSDKYGTTQVPGTNDTSFATTGFVQAAVTALLNAVYPVGSVYTNAVNGTNPGTLLGFGTWTAFGAGRVAVGFDAGNALFDSPEETGGSYDATLVSHTHTATSGNQSVDHTHTFSGTTAAVGDHQHPEIHYSTNGSGDGPGPGASCCGGAQITSALSTGSAGAHSHSFSGTTSGMSVSHNHAITVDSAGSSGTNANVQPYITVYMWKRTA
jgi:hypothetical protein